MKTAIAREVQIEIPMVGRSSEEILEAEEQSRSLWVSKMEHKRHIFKEALQSKLDGFQILKVPEVDRQPTAHYTPRAWRFGLHNRENLDTTGSEDVKLAVVVMFGLEEQSKWIDFCDFVVPDPKSMLTCYWLPEEITNLIEDEVKQVLALDALFLAVLFDMHMWPDESRRLWDYKHIKVPKESVELFLSAYSRWNYQVDIDLCKMENQIPFVLIKRAIKHIERLADLSSEEEDHLGSDANGGQVQEHSPEQQTELEAKEGSMGRAFNFIKRLPKLQHKDEDHCGITNASIEQVHVPYLEAWMKSSVQIGMSQFMELSDDYYKNPNAHLRLSESHHILEAAYMAICGDLQCEPDHSQQWINIRIPPAMRLKDSGIKIVGVIGPLCTTSYDKKKKCLYLPKMRMCDETGAVIRNMSRYEFYRNDNRIIFHDYVFLMLDLVQSPEDIKILIDCSVIDSAYEHRNEAFKMWKGLGSGLTRRVSCKEHNEMKRDIINRCKLQRHRFWSEFKQLFLSRPWLLMSAMAVTLVTFATLIQTYVAIIGSNGMKPQFKP